jgi:hypothetical protein
MPPGSSSSSDAGSAGGEAADARPVDLGAGSAGDEVADARPLDLGGRGSATAAGANHDSTADI